MYLYMLLGYVVLRTCDYVYVLVHAYAHAMSHHDMHCTLYSLSQHHLASTLAQSELAGCGFSKFSWTSTDGIYKGLIGTSGPRWSFWAICLLVVHHVTLYYAHSLM